MARCLATIPAVTATPQPARKRRETTPQLSVVGAVSVAGAFGPLPLAHPPDALWLA